MPIQFDVPSTWVGLEHLHTIVTRWIQFYRYKLWLETKHYFDSQIEAKAFYEYYLQIKFYNDKIQKQMQKQQAKEEKIKQKQKAEKEKKEKENQKTDKEKQN